MASSALVQPKQQGQEEIIEHPHVESVLSHRVVSPMAGVPGHPKFPVPYDISCPVIELSVEPLVAWLTYFRSASRTSWATARRQLLQTTQPTLRGRVGS